MHMWVGSRCCRLPPAGVASRPRPKASPNPRRAGGSHAGGQGAALGEPPARPGLWLISVFSVCGLFGPRHAGPAIVVEDDTCDGRVHPDQPDEPGETAVLHHGPTFSVP